MTLADLPVPLLASLSFATFFFTAALLTGAWKWRAMAGAPDGRAHVYVDIAHHAALHYGPFITLSGVLASLWPATALFPAWIPVTVMGGTMVLSLSRYVSLGLGRQTTNQLYRATVSARLGLVFFFLGSVLPGLTIAAGAASGFWLELSATGAG